MTEDAATYEPGAGQGADGTKPCACGCGRDVPTFGRHKREYYDGACRARASCQRKRHGPEPGQVKRCQVIQHGTVSITLHLPETWAHRLHELVPGTWVDVVPHRSET